MKSRPLGISYDDGSNSVFIATLKSAVGYLTSSNTVTYRDAFTGFKADLVCTYRRGGFECDLVFRQQPPTPSDYGLDANWSTLQMVTEFFNTADPEQIPGASDEWFGLQDATLKFGKLTMTRGKAFAFKGTNSNSQLPTANSSTAVYKTWLKSGGRTFLIESVPVIDLAEELAALPLTAKAESGNLKPENRTLLAATPSLPPHAARLNSFPPAHEFISDTNQILLAANDFRSEPGVVLDYNTVDTDQTDNFTFETGITYYISGGVNFNGNVIFNPGTVLKFSEDFSGSLDCNVGVDCQTTADHPAFFTSVNDDSIGDSILGVSTGTPAVGGNLLILNASIAPLKHLRMSYANCFIINFDDSLLEIWDSQFLHCDYNNALGCINNQTRICLNNVLFSQCAAISYNDGTDDGGYVYGSHITLNQSAYGASQGGQGCVANFTNSVNLASSSGIYQSAANAHYYLAANSPYRNAGTTAIDAALPRL